MTKKEHIQETAIKLFNEKGYNHVSLRNIAKQAGTTIGNLTYHFPQKEALLLSILEDLHQTFSIHFSSDFHDIQLLGDIVDSFVTAQRNEEKSPFYYVNIYDLTKNSSYIEERNKDFQKQLYDYYIRGFHVLKENHIFISDVNEQTLSSLAYAIVTLAAVWLQNNVPYSNEQIPKHPIAEVLCRLLQPYLSEIHMNEYMIICESKGISL